MKTLLERFLSPTIDSLFDGLDPKDRFIMAIAILRRHTVVSENTGAYIGYHYFRDAAAEMTINALYRKHIKANDPEQANNKVCNEYNELDYNINAQVLSSLIGQRIMACNEKLDRDQIEELHLPNFGAIDGIIDPNDQKEWVNKRVFEHVNLDQVIIDAIYHDQNIIFIVGPATGEPILIGDTFNNEIINIMFADKDFNMLSAKTYKFN